MDPKALGDHFLKDFLEKIEETDSLRRYKNQNLVDEDAAQNLDPYKLTGRQQAMYDLYERVVNDFGMFEQDSGPDGAHYMEESPFEEICCSKCIFFEPNGACDIVSGEINKCGVCKLWIVPEDIQPS